ncbi:MAG: hypothetical protein ACXADB_10490 [Candidatus Hermodarchaeia archaeon]
MVTIIVTSKLEGLFFAEVEIQPDIWLYECVIRSWSDDHLFCFGDRLPATFDAVIRVYEIVDDAETVKVFEGEFVVYDLIPTPTSTPVPGAPHTYTPSPTPTLTNTPTPTSTVAPPTSPWLPTNTPTS